MGRARWVCLGSRKIHTDTRYAGRVFHHGPKHGNAVRLISIIIIINCDFKIDLLQIIVSYIFTYICINELIFVFQMTINRCGRLIPFPT